MNIVILDRDGVINEDSDDYIKSPDEWRPIAGSLEAISLLNQAGLRVVVASNQSGIGRGYFDIASLDAMHEKFHTLLEQVGGHVDGIFYCPHHPDDHCDCRKPRPGLLHQIAQRFSIDLNEIPFIGDSFSDIECALAVNALPVLVRTGKGLKTESLLDPVRHARITVFDDLSDAVRHFLKQ